MNKDLKKKNSEKPLESENETVSLCSSLDTTSESSLDTSVTSSDTGSESSLDLSNTSTEFDSEETIELDSETGTVSQSLSTVSSSNESKNYSICPYSQDSIISCFSDTLYDLNDQNWLSRLDYITPPPSPVQPAAPPVTCSPKFGPVIRKSVRMNNN
jgi:hypothetical protein